jgi:hypothetical protein
MQAKKGKTNGAPAKTGRLMKITSDTFHSMVERRAFELFLQRNCEHGNDMGDWFNAEKEISEKYDSY